MFIVFKKSVDEWILISSFENINDALFEVDKLKVDGNEYRIERIDGANSEILEQ